MPLRFRCDAKRVFMEACCLTTPRNLSPMNLRCRVEPVGLIRKFCGSPTQDSSACVFFLWEYESSPEKRKASINPFQTRSQTWKYLGFVHAVDAVSPGIWILLCPERTPIKKDYARSEIYLMMRNCTYKLKFHKAKANHFYASPPTLFWFDTIRQPLNAGWHHDKQALMLFVTLVGILCASPWSLFACMVLPPCHGAIAKNTLTLEVAATDNRWYGPVLLLLE